MLPSTTLLALSTLLTTTLACCPTKYPASEECFGMEGCFPKCADMTRATPCCGNGPCNIFCCNCDDGCRKGPGERRPDDGFDEVVLTDADAFRLADVRGIGEVTLEEYLGYMDRDAEEGVLVKWFEEHDIDGNGVITANETRKAR